MYKNKIIVITGGTGSFGKTVTKQMLRKLESLAGTRLNKMS